VNVLGVVELFDGRRGDGFIRSDDGGQFYFHCVNIADGSRVIEAGTRVRARRDVGLQGRDDAVAIEKLT
jgi:cold shock CspA family protein